MTIEILTKWNTQTARQLNVCHPIQQNVNLDLSNDSLMSILLLPSLYRQSLLSQKCRTYGSTVIDNVREGSTPYRVAAMKSDIAVIYHEASNLQAPLENTKLPVFYTHTNCPFAHRVWMTLLEKNISHELVQIDLSSKPAWFPQINRKGLVPALRHNGKMHIESLNLCKYIDEHMDGLSLMPRDHNLKKEALASIERCDEYINNGLRLIGGSDGPWAITDRLGDSQISAFEEGVYQMSDELEKHKGLFLCGQSTTLVDFVVFPFFVRFKLVLEAFFDYKIPSERVISWLDAMRGCESSCITTPDEKLLLNAYRRHRRLDFFDYTTYTIKELHPNLEIT